jgi:hypothetical protein
MKATEVLGVEEIVERARGIAGDLPITRENYREIANQIYSRHSKHGWSEVVVGLTSEERESFVETTLQDPVIKKIEAEIGRTPIRKGEDWLDMVVSLVLRSQADSRDCEIARSYNDSRNSQTI